MCITLYVIQPLQWESYEPLDSNTVADLYELRMTKPLLFIGFASKRCCSCSRPGEIFIFTVLLQFYQTMLCSFYQAEILGETELSIDEQYRREPKE